MVCLQVSRLDTSSKTLSDSQLLQQRFLYSQRDRVGELSGLLPEKPIYTGALAASAPSVRLLLAFLPKNKHQVSRASRTTAAQVWRPTLAQAQRKQAQETHRRASKEQPVPSCLGGMMRGDLREVRKYGQFGKNVNTPIQRSAALGDTVTSALLHWNAALRNSKVCK